MLISLASRWDEILAFAIKFSTFNTVFWLRLDSGYLIRTSHSCETLYATKLKTSNSYKAIIFDLGKVVFDLSFDRTFQYWANISGKQFNDIKDKFSFDSTFDKFERGEISPEFFRRTISAKLDIILTDEQFDAGWCDLYLDTYSDVDSLLNSLKRNYNIGALTNTNVIHKKVWEPKYAQTLKHFEKVFSSSDILVRKPEKEAYQIVLDHFKVRPSETLFLDDNAENIAGAQSLGIKTILVTSQEQMFNDIQKLEL